MHEVIFILGIIVTVLGLIWLFRLYQLIRLVFSEKYIVKQDRMAYFLLSMSYVVGLTWRQDKHSLLFRHCVKMRRIFYIYIVFLFALLIVLLSYPPSS